jgi:release factor glutamine methyltransferase
VETFRPVPRTIIERLRTAGCIAADEEAAELLAAAPDDHTLEGWIQRRERGEPLAWITGSMRFCGHDIRVDPGVYVPRAQSEELAHRAATLLESGGFAVDLCTGAGAIAAHLAAVVPTATVIGVDIDPRAAVCARRNGVRALRGDLGGPLRPKIFDLVTAVAPYVPTRELRFLAADVQRFEPRLALDGGVDGLDLVRRILDSAAHLLRPGGWLLVELGAAQDRALQPQLAAAGFSPGTSWFDEDGDLRGLATQLAR